MIDNVPVVKAEVIYNIYIRAMRHIIQNVIQNIQIAFLKKGDCSSNGLLYLIFCLAFNQAHSNMINMIVISTPAIPSKNKLKLV